jgi:D-alanine-D-alanine ligase
LKKVAVLYGGISREREISLRSGKRVYEALLKKAYNAELIDVREDFLRDVWSLKKFDAIFVMLHGTFGEDGTIQGVLEYLGVPYTGSGVQASAICFDKLRSYQILSGHVTLPKYMVIKKPASESPFGFPCFLKPRMEGSSIGAHVCHDEKELYEFSKIELERYDEMILMEYVRGRELTVSIVEIDGKPQALPILELRPKKEFYDYEAKYTPGMTEFILPAPLNEEEEKEVIEASLKAYKELGCRSFARIDGILRNGKFHFLEANSIPGMTETSDLPASARAAGYTFEDIVEIVLKSSLKSK